MVVFDGDYAVEWEWIGEGISGDYDENDPMKVSYDFKELDDLDEEYEYDHY